jgi:hypothetical protein
VQADEVVIREWDEAMAHDGTGGVAGASGVAERPSGHQVVRQQEIALAVQADERLSRLGYAPAVLIGSAQILALLAGISRSGVTMVAGMFRGLSREDAARFAFLLATPVILAAGVLELPKLTGPLGNGIHGQILVGSVLSFVGAYLSSGSARQTGRRSCRTSPTSRLPSSA